MHCRHTIAWYDLLPVISWFILYGRCRYCHKTISWLYPFIEVLAGLCALLLFTYSNPQWWLAYTILLSALLITIRTDLEQLVIIRYFSLGLIPFGWLLSFYGFLPVNISESLLGTLVGHLLLELPRIVYKKIRRQEGMGNGDPELLAMIGAFTGPLGAWLSLLLGSLLGSIIGLGLLILKYDADTRIPFGPLLAFGCFIYLWLDYVFLNFLNIF